MSGKLTFHEILSLADDLYDPWLDLYQQSFPVGEQMLVSSHNRALRDRERGVSANPHLLAALDDRKALVAMARYDAVADGDAAALWYLAVVPALRGKGVGAALYGEVVRRVRAELPSAQALLFEVEDPETTRSDEERELALRRIAFYRRNGARRLGGIRYTQSVGWQPAVPMHIMVHLLQDRGVEQAFRLAKRVFGDALQEDDLPAWE